MTPAGWAARIPRGVRRGAAIVAAALAALLLLLAVFPWGMLVGTAIRPISGALGRQVSIGSATRLDWLSLDPEIALLDVTVAQPPWIGRGTMAHIRRARMRLPVLPLLFGRFRPGRVELDGLRLTLLRTAEGRASWDGDKQHQGRHAAPSITDLVIRDGAITLDDRRRHVKLAGTLAADARGFAVAANGTLRDRPMTLRALGAPIVEGAGRTPYPLHIVVRSPLASLDSRLAMDRPLDTAAFTARMQARGEDLTYLNDILQAGLFPTQAFVLSGTVRHDGNRWAIRGLRARIGRSNLTGRVDVTRLGPRTGLDATVDAATLDFDDFASDAEQARGAREARVLGERIIPGTTLQLGGLRKVDGKLRLDARRLLVASGSPFRALETVATLDHGRLTLDPLDIALVAGHATGRLVDDDRRDMPRVDIDLSLANGTVETLLTRTGSMRGPLEGRLRLSGSGRNLRAAMGRAEGSVGFAVPRGTARRDYATFAGGDVGKSIGAAIDGPDARVALRCMVGRFVGKDGKLVPDPLVIDTAVSRADGHGVVDLATERLDLVMVGRPKRPGLLVSSAPTRITGTLAEPRLDIKPPRASDNAATGTIARIGYFLKGLKVRLKPSVDPPAKDADCPALIRAVMR